LNRQCLVSSIAPKRVAAFVESGKCWSSLTEYKDRHSSQSEASTRLFTRGFIPLDRNSPFDSSKEHIPRAFICGTVPEAIDNGY
jgi:hypothetical protein